LEDIRGGNKKQTPIFRLPLEEKGEKLRHKKEADSLFLVDLKKTRDLSPEIPTATAVFGFYNFALSRCCKTIRGA